MCLMCWIHSCMCISSGGGWGQEDGLDPLASATASRLRSPQHGSTSHLFGSALFLSPRKKLICVWNGWLVPWRSGSFSCACHSTQVTRILYIHTLAQMDPYDLFLISRGLRGGTCCFQRSTWELSQLQQKTTREMCFECTETDTLKNIHL